MDLKVIGCGGAYIDKSNHQPCYLISEKNTSVLLDLGCGSVSRMSDLGVYYAGIEYVFISHLHPDHVADLPALIQARLMKHYTDHGDIKGLVPLKIISGEGVHERLKIILDILDDELHNFFTMICIKDGDTAVIGDFTLKVHKTPHQGSVSYASRWEAGEQALSYTGDSIYTEPLADFVKDSNILICDSSSGTSTESNARHMSAFEAGKLASGASVEKLILVHTYENISSEDLMKAARKEFEGTVVLGRNLEGLFL